MKKVTLVLFVIAFVCPGWSQDRGWTLGALAGWDYAVVNNTQYSALTYSGAEFRASVDWAYWGDWFVYVSTFHFTTGSLTNPVSQSLGNSVVTMKFRQNSGYLFGGKVAAIPLRIYAGPFSDFLCYDGQTLKTSNTDSNFTASSWYFDFGFGPGVCMEYSPFTSFNLRLIADAPLVFLSFHPQWSQYPYNVERMNSFWDVLGTGQWVTFPTIQRYQCELQGVYQLNQNVSATLGYQILCDSRDFADQAHSLSNVLSLGLEITFGGF